MAQKMYDKYRHKKTGEIYTNNGFNVFRNSKKQIVMTSFINKECEPMEIQKTTPTKKVQSKAVPKKETGKRSTWMVTMTQDGHDKLLIENCDIKKENRKLKEDLQIANNGRNEYHKSWMESLAMAGEKNKEIVELKKNQIPTLDTPEETIQYIMKLIDGDTMENSARIVNTLCAHMYDAVDKEHSKAEEVLRSANKALLMLKQSGEVISKLG